jgi:predicted  nucleic acid-binding Zn-ribbon protein
MRRRKREIDQLTPQGIDDLREKVAGIEKRLQASESAMASALGNNELPAEADELEQFGERLKDEIDGNQNRIDNCKQQADDVELEIEGTPDVDGAAAKRGLKTDAAIVPGLRQQESSAKVALEGLNTTVKLLRDALDRVPTAEQIDGLIRSAQADLSEAKRRVEATRLTTSEETIRERLAWAEDGLRVLSGQLDEAMKELHHIQGAMTQSEGLHQKRAAATARVEELREQTEREQLESEAFDRLYALFEECREKRLGAVMGPIHDRVLRWMRLLRIGAYQSIGFNDQFLPEKLISGDGASELLLDEESTGTIEQIALMVRLALGATLSFPEEPVVAMLDDPLTHSDVLRLDLMRAILKSASVGDTSSTPPAGPLQIVVFTCHPEWFAIDGARMVDLSKPDVLTRSCC